MMRIAALLLSVMCCFAWEAEVDSALLIDDQCVGTEGCTLNALQMKSGRDTEVELAVDNEDVFEVLRESKEDEDELERLKDISLKPARGPSDALSEQVEQNVRNSTRLKYFTEIDHSRLAEKAGFEMPPVRVLLFSDELLEVALVKQSVLTAIDLPIRVLAYQSGEGTAALTYNSYEYIESRYKLKPNATLRSLYNNDIKEALTGIPSTSVMHFKNDSLPNDGLVTIQSAFNFSESDRRVQQVIGSQAAWQQFGIVDFQALVKKRGEELLPAKLFLFGSPGPGAMAMKTAPTLGLDAFCQKFLLWQREDGLVQLNFNDLPVLAERQGFSTSKPLLEKMTAGPFAMFSKALGGEMVKN
eukprot:TRINITY_DN111115_c0_g1_i1.p1 TRINITY_DN111115_c0_g1~~TRINITY_DN111115_c0_g1_i1.p1  ORF type:complete len:357 (-),score=78.08 TRINITY_DN111115_c0_g1_i1:29-1099(-)